MARGLVTGIIGGLVVGFLSGQPLQVSGPAAGLSVMVWEIVQTRGLSALSGIVLVAGVVQLAAGLAKLGQWFRAVSPAVIQGMLAGIGVLILSQQWHVLFDGKPLGSGLKNIAGMPGAFWDGVTGADHRGAAVVAAVASASLIGWLHFQPKSLSRIPSALVAVVAASLVAWVFKLNVAHVSVPQDLSSMVAVLSPHTLASIDVETIRTGFAFALIASAETLLSATAVDRCTTDHGLSTTGSWRARAWATSCVVYSERFR
jgi:MFS superfamily sulfate permease-like transporter